MIKRLIFTRQLGDGVQVRHCQWFELSKRRPFSMAPWDIQVATVNAEIAKQAQRSGKPTAEHD